MADGDAEDRPDLVAAGDADLVDEVLAGLQVGELGAEGLDTLAALGLGQGAGLEGAQVALDGGFGLVDLAADGGEFTFGAVAGIGGLVVDGAGYLLGEVGAGKGVQRAGQDGLLELVGGQPLGWAGLLAVAQPAVGAHQLAGQQVVGGVAGAGAAVLAALRQQPLGRLEGGGVDQGRVGGGVVLAAVVDLAEVDAVAQHGDDRGVAPGPASAGPVA